MFRLVYETRGGRSGAYALLVLSVQAPITTTLALAVSKHAGHCADQGRRLFVCECDFDLFGRTRPGV